MLSLEPTKKSKRSSNNREWEQEIWCRSSCTNWNVVGSSWCGDKRVSETTVHSIKNAYVEQLGVKRRSEGGGTDDVSSLPVKKRGRQFLLGHQLDNTSDIQRKDTTLPSSGWISFGMEHHSLPQALVHWIDCAWVHWTRHFALYKANSRKNRFGQACPSDIGQL